MPYQKIVFRRFGLRKYEVIEKKMFQFTNRRKSDSEDEIWFLQYYPVFTLGRSDNSDYSFSSLQRIPIIRSDRGGKITYHGPGQQIMYFLIDLRRRKLNIRRLIIILEKVVINTLSLLSINSFSKKDAPGIYVGSEKICSFGLCVKRGCSLYGLSLNVDMDLNPFSYIHPCGQIGLRMTQISYFNPKIDINHLIHLLFQEACHLLNSSNSKQD